MSFPSWGAFKELLAREARRGACPLGDWPAGIACVLLSSFQELVEFYQQNSLKDCFKSLDTILQFPFKEPERRAISKPAGRRPDAGGLYPYLLPIVEEKFEYTMDIPSSEHVKVISVNQQEPFPLLSVPLLLSGLHTHLLGWKMGQGLLLYWGR